MDLSFLTKIFEMFKEYPLQAFIVLAIGVIIGKFFWKSN